MARAREAEVLAKSWGLQGRPVAEGREVLEVEQPGSLVREGLRRARRLLMYFEMQNRYL